MQFQFMKLNDDNLQPTTRLKPPLQIILDFKISKILKNCLSFCNATGLQSRISGFNKTESKENVSCQCSEIAGNTLSKDL